jgi:uncharacterized protein (TIGR02147 family)
MNPWQIQILSEEFEERKTRNSRYSLRAFAKSLAINPSTLCSVLKGKRALPQKDLIHIADRLKLEPGKKKKFINNKFKNVRKLAEIINIKVKTHDSMLLEPSHYKVIADWEYYAFFSLLELKQFQYNNSWIAKKLNISENRVIDIVDDLLNCHLLKINADGQPERIFKKLNTTDDIFSEALIEAHKGALTKAEESLNTTPVELRDFSSTTVAIDPNNIESAKLLIREFKSKLALLLSDGEKTEVYHLGVQLFPLTKLDSHKTPGEDS